MELCGYFWQKLILSKVFEVNYKNKGLSFICIYFNITNECTKICCEVEFEFINSKEIHSKFEYLKKLRRRKNQIQIQIISANISLSQGMTIKCCSICFFIRTNDVKFYAEKKKMQILWFKWNPLDRIFALGEYLQMPGIFWVFVQIFPAKKK